MKKVNDLNRRDFMKQLGLLSAAAGLGIMASSCKKENLDPIEAPEFSFDIRELELRVDDLQKNMAFWSQVMGFELLINGGDYFTVRIGASRLTFRKKNTLDPPINHFSINIPRNQVENALDWLKNEGGKYADGPTAPVTIVKDEITNAEIINKPLYNANSVFFNDHAGNIIELISRNELDTVVEGPFSREQFLRISEVSVITRNSRDCQEKLEEEFGAKPFPRGTSGYTQVGGVNGVMLLVIPGRPWIPTESVVAFPYDTVITVQHPQEKEFLLPGSPALIRTEA
jgi:catechol 2,3-dioxygenase-like lactoylglutathione lyase family enzyme